MVKSYEIQQKILQISKNQINKNHPGYKKESKLKSTRQIWQISVKWKGNHISIVSKNILKDKKNVWIVTM